MDIRSVVRVGKGGRGFIVEGPQHRRLVITAAHCLPVLPAASPGPEETTYQELIALWAECLFVDPIADIAVLGSPDDRVLSEQACAYEMLAEEVPCITIGSLPRGERSRGDVLSLENIWLACSVTNNGLGISIEDTGGNGIESGMSGSPVIVGQKAVGIVCTGTGTNAYLMANLPGWIIAETRVPQDS